MTARIIDGKAIAADVRAEVARAARSLTESGTQPGLATVLVGDDPASHVYVRAKRKACAQAGIKAWDHDLPAATSQGQLLELLDSLAADAGVHGILVQLPLPLHIDEQVVLDAVPPAKDADGFHPYNFGRLLAGTPDVAPATPAGIQQLLIRSGVRIEGAHVVVVGRSNIVGKPLAALLMQKAPGADATVTVCHTRTMDLEEHTRRADILVVAAGRPRIVTADMVKPGAVVVDVGVNRVADPNRPSGTRLVGDVDFEPVSRIASFITPVPGGVGPMTIAMLLRNTVRAAARGVAA